MNASSRPTDQTLISSLDRHAARRRRGIPTISVLVGAIEPAISLMSLWSETLRRSAALVRIEEPECRDVVVYWTSKLAERLDLGAIAVDWLARRIDRDTGSLKRSLGLMTRHEVKTYLESVLPTESQAGVERLGRCLIDYWVEGTTPNASDFVSNLDLVLENHGRPWLRIFSAIGELVSPEYLPILAVTPTEPSVTSLKRIAHLLAELAQAQPRVPLALLVTPGQFSSYAALAPPSRAKALLCESVLPLPLCDLHTLADLPPTPVGLPESAPLRFVESPRDELISADRKSGIGNLEFNDPRLDNHDHARSAAERYLFERLQSITDTAGLFELNATLDFHFGLNRRIEIDLVARSLQLAVEVDGYHHFTDPEAYRRDRRKDLELQKHGYLVVRVLANDVVDRLEEVLDTILTTVAFRRAVVTSLEATP
jgi:hypothetical protein